MDKKEPSLEETLKDLKTTQEELDAYLDLERAFITLTDLPDQNAENRKLYRSEALKYRRHAVECSKTLTVILEYKKKLEK